MIDTVHYSDELQELLDGRLGAERSAEIRLHLQGCTACRAEYEALMWVKRAAAAGGRMVQPPPDLARAIAAALDREDAAAAAPALRRRWLLAAAAAAPLLAIGLAWWLRRPVVDLPGAVSGDYLAVQSGELSLGVRAASGAEVEAYFRGEGLNFPTRVIDLDMMGYRIRGGRAQRLPGRASALFAYDGPDRRTLVCQMYPGTLSELPAPLAVRVHRGFQFYVYQRGAVTLVFWQEGPVVCVLAGDFGAEDVIALAFEKAMRP